jgi:hypothetical protein
LVHVFFWIYIINQALFPYYISKGIDKNYHLDIIIYVALALITFYCVYLSVPLLMSLRSRLLGILLGILLLASLVPLRVGLEYLFWKYLVTATEGNMVKLSSSWWLNSVRLVVITSTYAFLIRLAIGWFDSQKLKSELLLQNQTSELALLRSQVNPHFLFNTLNNIYSLVYKKSEEAPAAVMKMSSIMRYMLIDAAADRVLLEKEIDYLKSFIELQQLRTRQKDFVSLTISGETEGRTIVPMLLIPFVENAFKHGSRNVPSPGIIITLNAEAGWILFEVSNYLKKGQEVPHDHVRGIGLNNVRRRLELLFPGKHTLETWEDQDMYHVKLILESV